MLLKQGIKYSTFSPRAGGIDFYGDTLFTTEKMVREKPERVAAFLEASLNGWKYALENTDEIIDLILTKYTQRHSREHLIFEARMSKSLIMANVVELGYMNQGRWLNIANTLKMLNKIPDDFSLEGFIYERNPAPDFRWLYISLAVAIVIALLAFLISGRFYKLNRALNLEISQRIEIETSLKNSERKISNLLSNLPGIAYRSLNDDTYTMQFVSQGCYKLTGYEPSDLIANKTVSYLDLIHPEDREMVNQEVKSALYENRPFKLFYRITDRQGHLKWVWEQGRGIYSEDGEIELIDGLIADVTKQRKIEKEREDLIAQLQAALKEIKTLSGMLPICAACKKIRDDKGYWNQIESYIQKHSEAEFSHGMCPDCLDKLYGDQDWYQKRDRK
jgi:PAS domain S-box-containing protein